MLKFLVADSKLRKPIKIELFEEHVENVIKGAL